MSCGVFVVQVAVAFYKESQKRVFIDPSYDNEEEMQYDLVKIIIFLKATEHNVKDNYTKHMIVNAI